MPDRLLGLFSRKVGAQSRARRTGHPAALHPGRLEFLIVQATSLPNVGARVAKAKGRPELALWLAAGSRFEVHGWAKRRGLWVPKVVEVRAEDLADVVLELPPRKRQRSP
jgi:hypothetical protein